MAPLDTLHERLAEIVGADHVYTAGDEFDLRSGCTIPGTVQPGAVVHPKNAAQVQEIVRLAAELGLPVWTSSRGSNWGYGSAMGLRPGGITVILARMNRIIEVDTELAYAVIEPGVTYQQLNDYLAADGHRLWTDCTDSTPEGSVIGNALDRGVGYTKYGGHFDNLCGLEVVLPDGSQYRTSLGPEGHRTQHTYKWGLGPYLDGLFSQSNLGIVTQATIWLMPAPESTTLFFFELDDAGNLDKVVDATRELALHGVITHVHIANPLMNLSMQMPYPRELRSGSTIPEAELARLCRERGIAAWTMIGGLYGDTAQVRHSRARLKRALGSYGRILFVGDSTMKAVQAAEFVATRIPGLRSVLDTAYRRITGYSVTGVPTYLRMLTGVLKGQPTHEFLQAAYFKSGSRSDGLSNPNRDGAGLTWFAPIAPMTGKASTELVELCRKTFDAYGFEFAAVLITLNERTMLVLNGIFYDPADADETARASALYSALCDATWNAGFAQYRASTPFMNQIAEQSSAYAELTGRIKAALDPHAVIAPDRYGIAAPAHSR